MDLYLIYEFLRRLVKPFDQWKAYEEGVIDKNGKVLVDKKDRTKKQKDAWGYYDRLLANLKKLIGKLPGGKTRLASFAAALLLLREENLDPDNVEVLSEKLNFYLEQSNELLTEELTNVVGSGNIAGIGFGPDGEPGFTRNQMDRYKKEVEKKRKKLIDILNKISEK